MTIHPPSSHPQYLVIGHLTSDLLDEGGSKMGGTATYAGLTALALGNRVGLLSSCSSKDDLSSLANIDTSIIPAESTTTYRNISQPHGRVQYMYKRAEPITAQSVPTDWVDSPLVHLGPVADEIDPKIFECFTNSFIGITPQGWLRGFDVEGKVFPIGWHYDDKLLKRADATVLSLEDLGADPSKIAFWRSISKVLVLTRSKDGATIYIGDRAHDFPAPAKDLVEDTGAGDIFAACFFHAFAQIRDPFTAVPFAVELAACSVTRKGFASIPTRAEVESIASTYGIKVAIDD